MENEAGLKILFWISTVVMLLFTLAFLFITLIYHKKAHKIKQRQSENLLKATLETEKRERKRIAADFHDSVSGDLNAIRNYITILDQKEQDPEKRSILQEVKSSLEDILSNVQNINYNLMPPLLESSGLVPTLNDYFERVKKLNHISITVNYSHKNIPISSSDAYELFRIIQELFSNMLKHGKPKQIDFSIIKNSNVIEIEVSDDGIPFDFYNKLKNTSGMGLKNILSRLKHVEASLEQIPVDKGNKIVIRLNNSK